MPGDQNHEVTSSYLLLRALLHSGTIHYNVLPEENTADYRNWSNFKTRVINIFFLVIYQKNLMSVTRAGMHGLRAILNLVTYYRANHVNDNALKHL